ncbi:MAG: iron-containing alcohol dehydrogenase [Clostridia bacterium]|nr:iron-containing alcohol dehydrogenase [Clostridia bacterium]
MDFYFPTRIIIKRGCVSENAERLASFGKRCLIVTGKSSAKICGALTDIAKALEAVNVDYKIFDRITQNPLFADCLAGAEAARAFGAEFIIALGGGSPLDAGKAIACLAPNPDAGEKEMYSQKLKNPPLSVVAVGTTAGTGSEVTQIAVITGSDGRKKSFRADSAFPALALGDPRYTEFMPENVTRSTAADALSHCIESYFNSTANEFSRMLALRGARLITGIFKNFPDDCRLTPQQRDTLYLASVFGGMAISVTGTCIPHALGYFLTENHGIAHGTACAFFLPYFIEHNMEYAPKLAVEFFTEIQTAPTELAELIGSVAPKMTARVNRAELDGMRERWVNNGCLKKALGGIDNKYLENLLKRAFLTGEDK